MTDRLPATAQIVPLPVPKRPMTERSDDELMLLASGGEQEAFATLARRHLARVAQYCGKFMGDLRAGEEIAQDAMLQLWMRRREYQPRGKLQVYLLTLARNGCRNRVREDVRRARREEGIAAASPQASTGLDDLIELEQRRRLLEAVGQLPEKLRECVLLRFDQELAYSEIAEVAGCTEVAARSRVFHAIRQLRDRVAEGGRS